jgi:hypothetical protein
MLVALGASAQEFWERVANDRVKAFGRLEGVAVGSGEVV